MSMNVRNIDELNKDQLNLFKQMTDPNHDTPLTPTGYADMVTGNTIVQKIVKQFPFTVPAGQQQLIFDTQLLSGASFLAGDDAFAMTQSGPVLQLSNLNTVGGNYGGIVVFDSTDGEFDFGKAGTGCTLTGGLSVFTYDELVSSIPSKYRCVGKAFEIIPTTPQLSMGGDIVAFRLPGPVVDTNVNVYEDGISDVGRSVARILTAPPISADVVRLLPDTKSWEFKKGLYMPSRLNTAVNAPEFPFGGIWLQSQEFPYLGLPVTGFTGFGTAIANSFEHNVIASDTVPCLGGLSVFHNFDACGAVVSAPTAAAQSYTLKYTVYLESIPVFTPTGCLQLTLGKPSPWYDPELLEFIARVMAEMPVGTFVGNNASGDWFRNVARVGNRVLKRLEPMYTAAEKAGVVPKELSMALTMARELKKDIQVAKGSAAALRVIGKKNADVAQALAKGSGKRSK